jgi:hypothetical protein
MALYDDVKAFLARVEDPGEKRMNERTRLSAKQIAKLREDYPGIPEEYLAYLREVGWGAFRECQFMVYSGLSTADKILGEGVFPSREPELEILCFGDDFSGDLSGFLPRRRWAIVEVWHDDGTVDRVKKPFGKYIREQMLMGPGGKDLRKA